ncbi:MAG: ParA family protein [Spirochaetia bacterium]
MKTISFSAIKGGVGKSSLCILCANFLAAAGKRVLCIDLDLQNSLSFYFLNDPQIGDQHNMAKAFSCEDLSSQIIPIKANLDIIPSSFHLVKLRALQVQTLARMLPQIQNYDFCLIDTAPTFDNIVLNAVYASDHILTPACLSQFDWKSAIFYKDQIHLELGNTKNWSLLINRFKAPKSENPETEINQYLQLFESAFDMHLLQTRIPETTLLQKAIDTASPISLSKSKEKLFTAIAALCQEITHIKNIPKEF